MVALYRLLELGGLLLLCALELELLLSRGGLALLQLDLELPDVVLALAHLVVKHLQLLGQGFDLVALLSASKNLSFAGF